MLDVESIFNSIDGEANGFFGAGQLTTFIRLRGCNLRCTYCDTLYAQEPGEKIMTIQDIVEHPNLLNKVTITGGEPLLQSDCPKLIWDLIKAGKKVSVETNGSIIPPPFCGPLRESSLRYIVDYKLPSSGMEKEMWPSALVDLRKYDIIKFVIGDMHDYYIARGLIHDNPDWKAIKVFSPAIEDEKNYTGWAQQLADQMVQDADTVGEIHYSLQIHKVLWPNSLVEK